MKVSLWRFAHLSLAFIASIFIILAAVSGAILSFENHFVHSYTQQQANKSLSDFLNEVYKKYPSVTLIERQQNQQLSVQTADSTFFITPNAEKINTIPEKRSIFFQKLTTFHRSLFLGSVGRFFIGVSALILVLIAFSGLILTLCKDKGFKSFFSINPEEPPTVKLHSVLGKILFIPLLAIGISGTYLYLEKFSKNTSSNERTIEDPLDSPLMPIKDFETLKRISLEQTQKIEFPFSEFPEDCFIITLNDKILYISQFNGDILAEQPISANEQLSKSLYQIHTGKGLKIWSIILFISCLGIIIFIFSGFYITLSKSRLGVKNPFSKDDAQYIVVFGSENGSTFQFAKMFFEELIRLNHKAYLTSMNHFCRFKNLKHLIVFTSTYGSGESPSNATSFKPLFEKYHPNTPFEFSVFGFGSKSYPHFCKYAIDVHSFLKATSNSTKEGMLFLIHQQSSKQYIQGFESWFTQNNITDFRLPTKLPNKNTSPEIRLTITYHSKNDFPHLNTFIICLSADKNKSVISGDLLGITPEDNKERLYSIGKNVKGEILLCVKKHPYGKVSQMLYQKNVGDFIWGRWIKNASFHLPKNAKNVLFIATGTGISPFIGMLNHYQKHTFWLIWGGKKQNEFQMYKKNISLHFKYNLALSEDITPKTYVQDIIKNYSVEVAQLLDSNGIIFICGSFEMYNAVLKELEYITNQHLKQPLNHFIERGQIRSDCY